jgi:hypothetical protein
VLVAACCSLFALSCSGKPTARFAVQVKIESDPGVPVSAAKLSHAGEALAETDAQGLALVRLAGAPGEVVPIDVSCPVGYRSPERPLSIVLRALLEGRMPQYRATCGPLLRSLVVAVRAQNGADLPLKYLGKEIARTDGSGAGHALLKLPPGETVTLTLDTSAAAHARLLPHNPELKLTVQERDEVVVFDQAFTREAQKPARRRHKQTGPTRI